MSPPRIIIAGIGIVTPAGDTLEDNLRVLRSGARSLRPASLIDVGTHGALPAGEIPDLSWSDDVPRTHAIAIKAARQAVAQAGDAPPDAIVLGTTSGGMPKTELLMRQGDQNPWSYRHHALGSVTKYLADMLGCRGSVLTVSTACSSSATALIFAMELIRQRKAHRVLAGGADAICMLTYHGFRLLQLIDPIGTRPLDQNRAGMTLGEGAAFMMLEGHEDPDPADSIELLGGALTCDAYHPSSPHPEGIMALKAMNGALADAGITPVDIDYINLHGTGTRDNDTVECLAINNLFGDFKLPPVSSTKGTLGHSLGASGAIEAVVSCLAIREGLLPANVGIETLDESLGIQPILSPRCQTVSTVLSNSFGFGGNNASIVIGKGRPGSKPAVSRPESGLRVIAQECVTGAGFIEDTIAAIGRGECCAGQCPDEVMCADLPSRRIRRLKRLSRMSLALAMRTFRRLPEGFKADGVFVGTALGAQSESRDFLRDLFETNCDFASPTDFVGSVHNSVAAQIAIDMEIRGPNVTTTGDGDSFWQSIFLAGLLSDPTSRHLLLLGLDEYVPGFTNLLDSNVSNTNIGVDGGGILVVERVPEFTKIGTGSPLITPVIVNASLSEADCVQALIAAFGGTSVISSSFDFDAIFVRVSLRDKDIGTRALDGFLSRVGFSGPVWDYGTTLGNYATVSATAVALASRFISDGRMQIPGLTSNIPLKRGILVLEPGFRTMAIKVQ